MIGLIGSNFLQENAVVMIATHDGLSEPDLNITNFVQSINRTGTVCDIMTSGVLLCSPDLWDYFDRHDLNIRPYYPITIEEMGTKVLTGYVTAVRWGRTPANVIRIEFSDEFKRALDYFIDLNDPSNISNGETAAYWGEYLCGLAGLTFTCDGEFDGKIPVPAKMDFSGNSVAEGLKQIVALGCGFIYVTPGGHIHFGRSAVGGLTPAIFKGGSIQYDENHAVTVSGGNIFGASNELSDQMTRNAAIVWGQRDPATIVDIAENPVIISTDHITLDPPMPVDRIILYANSIIEDYDTADEMAATIIKEFGSYTDIKTFTVQGNPAYRLGRKAVYEVDMGTKTITSNNRSIITGINSTMDKDGYVASIKLDERCPNIASWSIKLYPIFAGTNGSGMFRSDDKGLTWYDYNTGLPVGSKVVTRLAAGVPENTAAAVNNNLYYNGDGTWRLQNLPDPLNPFAVNPHPTRGTIVGIDVTKNKVDTLTTDGVHSWVYTTSIKNDVEPVWISYPMTYTDGINTTYSIKAYDMDKNYVIASTTIATEPLITYSGETLGGTNSWEQSPTFVGEDVFNGNPYNPYPDGRASVTSRSFDYTGFRIYDHDVWSYDPWYGIQDYDLYYARSPWYAVLVKVINIPQSIRGLEGQLSVTITAQGTWYSDYYTWLETGSIDPYPPGVPAPVPPDPLGVFRENSFIYIANSNYVSYPWGTGQDLTSMSPPNTSNPITWMRLDQSSKTATLVGDSYAPLAGGESYGYFYVVFQPGWYENTGNGMGSSYWDDYRQTYDLHATVDSVKWTVQGTGEIINLTPSGSYTFDLYSVAGGITTFYSHIPTPAIGTPRIKVTDDGDIFVYSLYGDLLLSKDSGMTFESIYTPPFPVENNKIAAVDKVSPAAGSKWYNMAYNANSFYQPDPPTPSGWTVTSALPTGFVASDMLYSELSVQGLLVSNSNGNIAQRIMRFDPAAAPFNQLSQSDSGIPSGSSSAVTNLARAR